MPIPRFCHLYSDDPDSVAHLLHEHAIPLRDRLAAPCTYAVDAVEEFPVFQFSADDVPVDLTVLPRERQRQAPLDRVSDRPMRRASLGALEALLNGTDGDAP